MITYRQHLAMLASLNTSEAITMKITSFIFLTFFTMIQTTQASTLLASKEGPFENYNRCRIYTDRVDIEIFLGNGNRLIESTP